MGGWGRRGDVLDALCGGNVLELPKVLRLVVWIRLDWRTGISRKDVTDEIVMIHWTQTVLPQVIVTERMKKRGKGEIEEERKRRGGAPTL